MNKKIQPGKSFNAIVPFSQPNSIKVHIDHILPSIVDGQQLVVYRVFGKHKRWWHYFICSDESMNFYIDLYERQ
jgi:hypothetical protein